MKLRIRLFLWRQQEQQKQPIGVSASYRNSYLLPVFSFHFVVYLLSIKTKILGQERGWQPNRHPPFMWHTVRSRPHTKKSPYVCCILKTTISSSHSCVFGCRKTPAMFRNLLNRLNIILFSFFFINGLFVCNAKQTNIHTRRAPISRYALTVGLTLLIVFTTINFRFEIEINRNLCGAMKNQYAMGKYKIVSHMGWEKMHLVFIK